MSQATDKMKPTPTIEHLAILEAVLFASPRPLSIQDLRDLTEWPSTYLKSALQKLMVEYDHRGIHIREVANGYQMVTSPKAADFVAKMREVQKSSLSHAARETLTIIAYKQPITRAHVEQVRGVNSDHIVAKLVEKKLVCEDGYAQAPGRPALLRTTRYFLMHFGLKSIEDLPPLKDLDDIENVDIPFEHSAVD